MLIWIPETIHGEALTLSSFRKLLKQKPEFPKYSPAYVYDEDFTFKPEISKLVKSRFVLISNDVLPNSQKKEYSIQRKIVQSFNKKTKAVGEFLG